MRRAPLVLFSLLLCGVRSFAQTGWKEFSSPEGNFKVLFPGAPQQQTGPERNLHVFSVSAGSRAYGLSYAEYLPDSKWEEAVNGERDAFLNGLGAKIVSERQVSLGGHPGKWVKFTGNDVTGQLQIYLVNHRLYFLQALARKGEDRPADVSKFLNSFQLLSKPR